MSERLTVEASLREYLASHPTRRVTLDAREAGLLLADLDAARARAEAAEAKLARVEAVCDDADLEWHIPLCGSRLDEWDFDRRACVDLDDLRAALADPGTEAVRNVPLGMPEPAGPDDLRPALEAQSVSNLYVCTCGHLRPAHSGSREDDFCCLETDCHCNGWNPA